MQNRIDATLARLRGEGKQALVPFLTIGFPDIPTSEAMATAVLESGADMLELGVPFSDPLAEGPTIQMTSHRALRNGVTLATLLEVVTRLRGNHPHAPLVLMGYYNPFLRVGLEAFARRASDAGVDGVIVPDLPTEESGEFKDACEGHGIHLIPLLAPTSSDARIEAACKGARGFIYCLSLTGVTGVRRALSSDLSQLVGRIRRHSDLPVLVGFGISQRQHVKEVGGFADGAIVGSAILDAVDKAPLGREADTARDFVRALKGTNGRGD
ncbi:tryptophan synthase subunit alpha [Dehalococcoidia bacterium]|nr:tryptophan synthase subunit alpha [Dehalococcoidia bacterium]